MFKQLTNSTPGAKSQYLTRKEDEEIPNYNKEEQSWVIYCSKTKRFWQCGVWASGVKQATKYTHSEAENVIAMGGARKFDTTFVWADHRLEFVQ